MKRSLHIGISVWLIVIALSGLIISLMALYIIGNHQVDAYFSDYEQQYLSRQNEAVTDAIDSAMDGISLTLTCLANSKLLNEWIGILEGEPNWFVGRAQIESDVLSLLSTAQDSNGRDIRIAVVAENHLYYKYHTARSGHIPFDYADLTALIADLKLEPDGTGVIYLDDAQGTMFESYFSDCITMVYPTVFPTHSGDVRGYITISIDESEIMTGVPEGVCTELYNAQTGKRVYASGRTSDSMRTYKLASYPYVLHYAAAVLQDDTRQRIQTLQWIALGVAMTLGCVLVMQRKLGRVLERLLRYVGDQAKGKPPVSGIVLRRYVLGLIISSLILPGFLYIGSFLVYSRSLLSDREQSLIESEIDNISRSMETYFSKKNAVALALKYSEFTQKYLLDGSVEAQEIISEMMVLGNYQNAFSDDYYLYDAQYAPIFSNRINIGAEGAWMWSLDARRVYPTWRYRLMLSRGRESKWTLVRVDPIHYIYDQPSAQILDRIGYLRVDIRESELSALYAGVLSGYDARISVVNEMGEVLSSNDRRWMGESIKTPLDEHYTREGNALYVVCPISSMNGMLVVEVENMHHSGAISELLSESVVRMLLVLLVMAMISNLLLRWSMDRFAMLEEAIAGWNDGRQVSLKRTHISEIDGLAEAVHDMALRIDSLVKQSYARKLQTMTARMQMLRAQIEPHFLNNAMQTIASMIRLGESDKAIKMLEELGLFCRSIIREDASVRLESEIRNAQHYCNITVRTMEHIHVWWDIDEEALSASVPGCILQPLIENAFVHAFSGKSTSCNLYMRILAEETDDSGEKALLIQVEDDGIGMSAERLKQVMSSLDEEAAEHVGLRNVAQRLRLYYGDDCSFDMDLNDNGGVTITIQLPMSH